MPRTATQYGVPESSVGLVPKVIVFQAPGRGAASEAEAKSVSGLPPASE
jgi:hypothetical protein